VRTAMDPAWEEAMPPRLRMRPVPVLSEAEVILFQLMQSFAKIGPEAREAVPSLSKLMAEIKGDLRYEAALAVWQVDRTNAAAKRVLVEGLNVPSPDFPRRLTRYFKNMGLNELPILSAAMDHIDEEVRMAAFNVVM